MRTPWRFVADLVSRKPKPNESATGRLETEEIKALEYRPVSHEPVQDVDTVASGTPASIDPQGELKDSSPILDLSSEATPLAEDSGDVSAEAEAAVATAEPEAEAQPIASEETVLVAASVEADPAAVEKVAAVQNKKTASRRPARAVVKETAHVEPVVVPPTQTTAPKTFVEEMAVLDTEVQVLRRHLAAKLAEQNAQLRKMLARFEQR